MSQYRSFFGTDALGDVWMPPDSVSRDASADVADVPTVDAADAGASNAGTADTGS